MDCEPVIDGEVVVVVVEPLPSTEWLFDMPEELRTLFSAVELA